MQALGPQVLHGASWSLVGVLGSQVIALSTSIVLARVLGDSGFGELNVVRATIAMVASFLGAGLGVAATKHLAESRANLRIDIGAILGLILAIAAALSTVGGLVLLILSPLLADALLKAAHMQSALGIGGLLLVAGTISGVQNGALIGLSEFRAVAWTSIVEAVLALLLSCAGALVMDLTGAVIGLSVSSVAAMILRHRVLTDRLTKNQVHIALPRSSKDLRILTLVAIPSMIVSATIQPFEWLARVLLARTTDGFSHVAVFTAAQSLASVVQLVPAQIANASLPLLTQLRTIGPASAYRSTIVRSTLFVLICGTVVGCILAFAARPLMALYGESFARHNDVLIVLAITYGFAVVTMISTPALIAANQNWLQVRHKVLWGLAMIMSAAMLLDRGAIGLAFAYAIGNVAFTLAQLIAVRRVLVHK